MLVLRQAVEGSPPDGGARAERSGGAAQRDRQAADRAAHLRAGASGLCLCSWSELCPVRHPWNAVGILARQCWSSHTALKCKVLPMHQAGGASAPPAPAVQLSGCTVTMQLPGAQPPSALVKVSAQAAPAPAVSPQPSRPRPQSSAAPSKSRSFLGRLQQMSKSPQKGRPQQQVTVPATAAKPAVKQRAASVPPAQFAEPAGNVVAGHAEMCRPGRGPLSC